MVQIKGATIKETIDQIKRRAGDQAFQKVLGLLDEHTRQIFEAKSSPLPGIRWMTIFDSLRSKFGCSRMAEKKQSRAARRR